MMNRLPLAHVVVSGATHGNEFTGAFLARHWLRDSSFLSRDSFQTHVLLNNPQAFQMCRRYVQRDLNRSFHPSGVSPDDPSYELSRAREIESDVRKKCEGNLPDAIFDLHSTTAHMGLSLVLTNRTPFNLMLLAYLRKNFKNVNGYLWEEPSVRPGFFNSLSGQGFAIEVGPVANGVLDANMVLQTQALVGACLDFIELWNRKESRLDLPQVVPLYSFKSHVDYPRGSDGLPDAMIHPELQGRDFQKIEKGDPVFLGFDGRTIRWDEDSVWALFINEAAYYEKGIAFTTAQRVELSLPSWN
ncbi:MAG: hypothetical protein RIR26_2362 [Pseudomonadota bacterium]